MSFESLGLNPAILKTVSDLGYTTATPIQMAAVPLILQGHDLLASAQTGTGKTAAFILPALEKLSTPSEIQARGPRVLVLTPTRELALQVTAAAEKYGRNLRRVKVVSVLGGMPYPVQNKLLSQPYEILVATPGRLIDHIERGRIDFSRLEMLILDEADRMLDMGFFEDVERIAQATPATRQTVMFSATFEGHIARLATELLKNPQRIEIAHQQAKHENIAQHMHYVDDLSHKNRVLTHLVNDVAINQAIIFTATKRDADSLADDLQAAGHKVAALHGDMHQGARNRTITQMRHGSLRLLVATDVAARGLDVPGISHVINYDLPKNPEDYVHRIGRTGRAGANGIAVSLASPRDTLQLKRIERFTGQTIPAQIIEGLEPKLKPRASSGGKPRGEGRGEGRHEGRRYGQGGGQGNGQGNGQGGYNGNQGNGFGRQEGARGNGQPPFRRDETTREPRVWNGNREQQARPGRDAAPAYPDHRSAYERGPGAWNRQRPATAPATPVADRHSVGTARAWTEQGGYATERNFSSQPRNDGAPRQGYNDRGNNGNNGNTRSNQQPHVSSKTGNARGGRSWG